MIIDGKSFSPSQVNHVNELINEAWNNADMIIVESSSVFLELTDGVDSVELSIGGQTWHVHDRRYPTPVLLKKFHKSEETGEVLYDADDKPMEDNSVVDIGYGSLYDAAAKLSPLPRIEREERWELIIIALKCAAAESDHHGHKEQAAKFRHVYQEMELELS